MKLNEGFLMHDDGDQKLLVSTGTVKFSGLVRGNSTAGFIIECLAAETTEDEIVRKMCAQYKIDEATARRDAQKIIGQLRGIGAINE